MWRRNPNLFFLGPALVGGGRETGGGMNPDGWEKEFQEEQREL